MRILALDIETRANLVETYQVYGEIRISPDQIIRPVEMVSFAAKFLDGDMEYYSKYGTTRRKMLRKAWELLDEADVVLHYNGENFDVPHLYRELAEKGFTPPSPFKQIDLYKTARKVFRFPMNKLAYVAPALGLEEKVSHEGIYSLVRRCEAREEDAREKLREYNEQDVELLIQLYNTLRPWIPNHPNVGGFHEDDCCRVCAGTKLQRRGKNVTKAGLVYPRFQCMSCGAWSQGRLLKGSPNIKAVS